MQNFTISDLVQSSFLYFTEVKSSTKGGAQRDNTLTTNIHPYPLCSSVFALDRQALYLEDSTSKTPCSLEVTIQIGFKNSSGLTPAGI